jgi:hypothetical protein
MSGSSGNEHDGARTDASPLVAKHDFGCPFGDLDGLVDGVRVQRNPIPGGDLLDDHRVAWHCLA